MMNDNKNDNWHAPKGSVVLRLLTIRYFVKDLKETVICFISLILLDCYPVRIKCTNINGEDVSMREKQKLEHRNSTLRFLLRKITRITSRKKWRFAGIQTLNVAPRVNSLETVSDALNSFLVSSKPLSRKSW